MKLNDIDADLKYFSEVFGVRLWICAIIGIAMCFATMMLKSTSDYHINAAMRWFIISMLLDVLYHLYGAILSAWQYSCIEVTKAKIAKAIGMSTIDDKDVSYTLGTWYPNSKILFRVLNIATLIWGYIYIIRYFA